MQLTPKARKISISKLEWDGHPIRNIDDVKEYFNIKEILGNKNNFVQWLRNNDGDNVRVEKIAALLPETQPHDSNHNDEEKGAVAFHLVRAFFPEYESFPEYNIIKSWIKDNMRCTSVLELLNAMQLSEIQIGDLLSVGAGFDARGEMISLLLKKVPYSDILLQKLVDEHHVESYFLLEWTNVLNETRRDSIGELCYTMSLTTTNGTWIELSRKLGCKKALNPLERYKDRFGNCIFHVCGESLVFVELPDGQGGHFWICKNVIPKDVFYLHPQITGITRNTKQSFATCKSLLSCLSNEFGVKFDFPVAKHWRLAKKILLTNGNQIEWAKEGVIEPKANNDFEWSIDPSCNFAALRPVIIIEEDKI